MPLALLVLGPLFFFFPGLSSFRPSFRSFVRSLSVVETLGWTGFPRGASGGGEDTQDLWNKDAGWQWRRELRKSDFGNVHYIGICPGPAIRPLTELGE